MADNELVIRINGDPSNYKAAVHEAGEATNELKEGLAAIGEIVAFHEIASKISESIDKFHEMEVAIAQVKEALQNQGLAGRGLAEEYTKTAEAIEKKTGVDAASIITAQASAQSLLGQKVITQDLTKAVVDFAASQRIGVAEAFALVARATLNGTEILKRHNLVVHDAGTSSQRLIDITKALQGQFGGTAEKMADTQGSTAKLNVAFEDLEKKVGEKLVPIFDKLVAGLTTVIEYMEEHEEITNFGVAILVAAAAVGGLAAAISTVTFVSGLLTPALATLGALMEGLGIFSAAGAAGVDSMSAALAGGTVAVEGMSLAVKGLVGATGIGLLILAVTELYLHWNDVVPRMAAVWQGFVIAFMGTAKAVKEFLFSLFNWDTAGMKQAAAQAAEAWKKGWEEATKKIEVKTPKTTDEEKQNKEKEKAARERAQKQAYYDGLEVERKKAQIELLALQDANATKETVELKKQEIAILTEMENQKNEALLGILQKRLDHTRELQVEQYAVQREQDQAIEQEILAHNEAFQQMTAEQQRAFMEKNKAQLEAQLVTKRTQLQAAAKAEADIQIKAHNQFLADQQKFGTAYAAINMAMHSAIYQGSKSAFGELEQMTASHNNTLKSIGKVAAIANIVIKTAESAMNIYAGFSTIPIIGPTLGIAGAAAAIAFGAERISQVQGAAAGALVEGGTPGVDSVPFMLQQGELVSPRQNFEEVVGSVAATRAAAQYGGNGGASNDQVVALLGSINEQLKSMPGGGTINIQGDAIGDPAWVEAIAKKISNGLEFSNIKIFGINQGKRLLP